MNMDNTQQQTPRKFSIRRASTINTSKASEYNEKASKKSNGHSKSPTSPSSSEDNNSSSGFLKSIKEAIEVAKKDLPLMLDPQMISALLDAKHNINNLDDRKMLLEHGLVLLANTPPESEIYQKMQNAAIQLLYNDLTHPPSTYVSNRYAWRTADGSYNNVNVPEMGKAGNPYSRSVQMAHPLPRHMLPDPGLVFDTLLKREKFIEHPAGLSSLMFSFAALVIHSCFRTSHTQWEINETSSYVDLSPLYGNDQKGQDMVRNKSSGRGLLHPDVFFEDRLLLLPPAVCVLLVLFNRNHNFIAGKLLDINERGTWKDPSLFPASDSSTPTKLAQQDEEIFQTARLINCAWFANVVFSDYFAAILGLTRTGTSWWLNPFEQIRKEDHSLFERGAGNSVSVEFNCLYRWHATTSEPDERWIGQVFEKFFEGKKPEEVSPMDFAKGAVKAQKMMPDIEHWTFGDLKRGEDGKFRDEDLAKVLMDATTTPAAAFGARGTPAIMRLNEVMGIEQSRRWGCCSLNDFRKFLGLKPYTSFLEWNPDPEIAETASKLYYGDINNLELYVGLQAEETKPVITGAGLCPGYTISRAILADAIALTRGDRFYTNDLTPHNYTSWGLSDCMRPTTNPGFGGMLGRLFLRTLPREYTSDSTYTWFPLMTPKSMKGFTMKMGKDVHEKYDFERPTRAKELVVVSEYRQVKSLLEEKEAFRPPYADRVGAVVKGQGFFIAYDQTDAGLRVQEDVLDILLHASTSDDTLTSLGVRFASYVSHVLERDSYFLRGDQTKTVDISSVLKLVPVHWACEELAGIELKNDKEGNASHGEWTDEQMFRMLGQLYDFIFLDEEPDTQLENEQRARNNAEVLTQAIKHALTASKGTRVSIIGKIGSMITGNGNSNGQNTKKTSHEFLTKMLGTGKSVDELANAILSIMIVSVVELSQSMINMVNLYLDSPARTQLASTTPELLEGFAREAIRLDPPFAGVFREARSDQVVGDLSYKVNERLFLSIAQANRDPTVFPSPTEVLPARPKSAYLTSDGLSRSFGPDFVAAVSGAVLGTLFSASPSTPNAVVCKNLRRAPGISGQLKRFRHNVNGTEYYQYLDRDMKLIPWATEMILQYDV